MSRSLIQSGSLNTPAEASTNDRRYAPLTAIVAPVATRAFPMQQAVTNNLSDGTLLTNTYRIMHTVLVNHINPRLKYVNVYNNNGVETVGPNPITINASIEPTNGSPIAVTFQGASSVTIQPGGFVESDPLPIELLKGTQIFTRNHVSVASAGQKWPMGISTSGTRSGEGNTSPVSGADWTTSAWTVGSTQISAYAFGPYQFLGQPTAQLDRIYAVVGDSISTGFGESAGSQDLGYIERALQASGKSIAWQKTGYISAGISDFLSPSSRGRKSLILPSMTDAICQVGINAVASGATFASLQTSFQNLWNEMSRRGMRVWQTTLTPSTTTTDAYATLANQTVKSFESVRTQINDWIRTKPAPLTGYFEVADLAESSRNSGKWRVDLGQPTTDGVHPATVIAQAMAPGVSV